MNLKDYLYRVKELELLKYQQQALCNELSRIVYRESHPNYQSIKEYSSTTDLDFDYFWLVVFWPAVAGLIVGCICMAKDHNHTLQSLFGDRIADFFPFWSALAGGVLGIVLFIIHRIAQAQRERTKIEAENRHAQVYNNQLSIDAQKKQQIAEAQLRRAKESLNKTNSVLIEYYRKGIIHPNYQNNLVAISMFYEYFDTGRCSQLTGHEGAYNLYEQEVRMNIIISKLDDIISRLDSIVASQYQLSQSIKSSQAQVHRLCNTVQNGVDRLDTLNQNVELSNYYSRINAINTTYLAWFKRW